MLTTAAALATQAPSTPAWDVVTGASTTAFTNTLALLPSWLDPVSILERFGTAAFIVVLVIVFAECGLLIGFFLPGDSLLFVAGLFIAQGSIDVNIVVASLLIGVVAVAGNLVGYWIGFKAGPKLFDRPDSRFFKQEYVVHAHSFFEKYGAPAIVLARFVPIVRTFITAIAGVARMDFRVYAIYSAIGGMLWGIGVTVAGYFLGNFAFVRNNIELILLLVVVFSVVPILIEYLRHRRNRVVVAESPSSETPGA